MLVEAVDKDIKGACSFEEFADLIYGSTTIATIAINLLVLILVLASTSTSASISIAIIVVIISVSIISSIMISTYD